MGSVTAAGFRAAMGSFTAGVTVVTTIDPEGMPQGLAATAFSSVCVTPPTCLICLTRSGRVHASIRANECFAVNMLAAGDEAVSSRFASRAVEKFDGLAWRRGEALGCPLLEHSIATIECRVSGHYTAGDHDVFFGEVVSADTRTNRPLAYFRGRYAHVLDLEPAEALAMPETFFY